MTAENAQREPTMEEILASIRRIISEDDKPADAAGGEVLDLQPPTPVEAKAPPKPAPAPEPVYTPPPAPVMERPAPTPPPAPAPVIEPKYEEPVEVEASFDDVMVVEQEPAPEPVYTPPPRPVAAAIKPAPSSYDSLVGEPAAAKAAGALGKLMGTMMVQSGVTLDDVVREMLKPMLKEWLDANLPQLVESEVAREIERIRRMAR
jgi:cell pole-organizing protein PopZ